MKNNSELGTCHICGQHGKITFEHIPPKGAYNKRPVLIAYGRQLFEGRGIDDLKKERRQRGAGDYTLCGQCNNDTGAWYGPAYIEWVGQTVTVLERARGAPSLLYPFRIYPLRVIKQIIAMFFSVNSPEFRKRVPYLEQFVLNKHIKYLPPDIGVYAGYTVNGNSRSAGVSGILDSSGYSPQTYVVSEIAFAPFLFVLTLDCPCPDGRLVNISPFSAYGYDDIRTFDMRLPVLPVHTAYPTDYRTAREVEKAVEAAAEAARNQSAPSST